VDGHADPETWADTDPWCIRVRSVTSLWPLYTNRRPIISPLWDAVGTLTDQMKHRLWVECNNGSDALERSVSFNPNVQPGQTLAADDFPKARYDSVSWSVPAGSAAPTQTISGFVWPFTGSAVAF